MTADDGNPLLAYLEARAREAAAMKLSSLIAGATRAEAAELGEDEHRTELLSTQNFEFSFFEVRIFFEI